MAVAYKTFEDTATGTQRVIFVCKTCKNVFAYDYMVIPSGHGNIQLLRHDATDKRVWSTAEHCPSCNGNDFKSHEVIGTSSDHKCDAKCRNAKGPICECSCSGAHHGEGFLIQH